MELLDMAGQEGWTDEQVVARVLAGETALYEIIMRRYNQRLYRAVRAILRDDSETEDVLQDAYVRAYQHLGQFENRAPFSTWLVRIAINEAFARIRRRNRFEPLDGASLNGELQVDPSKPPVDPEQTTSKAELTRLLEEAVLALPEQYRTVLMLRDVEEMSTAETAAALSITEVNVKVRLHRGRALVRKHLFARTGASAKAAFPFMGDRCDRVVQHVFACLIAAHSTEIPSYRYIVDPKRIVCSLDSPGRRHGPDRPGHDVPEVELIERVLIRKNFGFVMQPRTIVACHGETKKQQFS